MSSPAEYVGRCEDCGAYVPEDALIYLRTTNTVVCDECYWERLRSPREVST